MTIFRPAGETDLAQMHEVFYLNEVQDIPDPPAPGDIPANMRHILQTGTMCVAEQDGQVLAFAAAITRGTITFLTDLFVRPDRQSAQLGKTLLDAVLPQDGLIHCTMSSIDPRALALYIRAGMRPQWPNFCLLLHGSMQDDPSTSEVELVEGQPGDPELVRWDAQVSGRLRPMDHLHWVQTQRAVPLWFRRQGQTVGYGYVQLGAGSIWHPDACTIGPLGVSTPEDATACILAAIHWACQQRAAIVRIDVPGPHPCLAPLLTRGFRITYVETFVSTASAPFFDPRCYIASGSDLF